MHLYIHLTSNLLFLFYFLCSSISWKNLLENCIVLLENCIVVRRKRNNNKKQEKKYDNKVKRYRSPWHTLLVFVIHPGSALR